MMVRLCLSLLLLAVVALPAHAAPLFKITEAFAGVDGADGTVDWFELTNFGDMSGNIGGYYYDDVSMDPTENFQLPNFDVAPSESVILLIEGVAADITNFRTFWGVDPSVQVGITSTGGSLGQGGDTIFVFDGNFLLSNVIDSLVIPGSATSQIGTIEDATGMGPLTNSVLGVRGAFASAGVSGIGNLVGSPGLVVPEPASVALMIIGAIAFAARRRSR